MPPPHYGKYSGSIILIPPDALSEAFSVSKRSSCSVERDRHRQIPGRLEIFAGIPQAPVLLKTSLIMQLVFS